MSRLAPIVRREFSAYFNTPLAAVFLVMFLFLTGIFTFNVGQLYERGQADLRPFFDFNPWLFLFLAPAISMRLWAEERRIGTIELVTTLPISIRDLVVGKWLAAWAFACVALVLTLPIWLTVEYLGEPDRGAILGGYVGSALMAGAFLAIGSALSAVTKNQVVAFVLCAVVCFLLLMAGYPVVLDFLGGWASPGVAEAVASVSLLTHFEPMERGVIDLRDVLFFAAVVAAFLWLNILLIEWKKAD